MCMCFKTNRQDPDGDEEMVVYALMRTAVKTKKGHTTSVLSWSYILLRLGC